MTARARALAWLAMATYFFATSLLLAVGHGAPRPVVAVAAWGMGASLGLSVAWWQAAERERGR